MLYVEQPVGVGFSYGGPPPHDEKDLAGDFYAFLLNFYSVFTEYQDFQLYMFGESYAGMYTPSMAHYIYRQNKEKHQKFKIPLAGIGVGNGLLDSRVQGPIRIDYAYFHGMIDSYTRDVLKELWDQCINGKKPMKEPFHSFDAPDDCGMLSAIPLAAGRNTLPNLSNGPNVYDVTTWDPYAILLGNNSISRFYNNLAVKEKMHAPLDTFWLGCMPGAGRRRRLVASLLIDDKPISTVPYIAQLLDGGIRVLMYNGDRDMACLAAGTEQLLNSMKWSGSDQWYSTPRGLWAVEDEPAGYAKAYKNLEFVVLYNSGHLAPYNVPVNSLDLLTRFLTNTSFYDYDLPNFGDYVKEKSTKKKYSKMVVLEEEAMVLPNESVNSSTLSLPSHPSVLPVLLAFLVGFGVAYAWQHHGRNSNGYQHI